LCCDPSEQVPPLLCLDPFRIGEAHRKGDRLRLVGKTSGHPNGSFRLSQFGIRPSIGTENPVPEEMDHREIGVRVPVMNKVEFLFPSEPCKPLKSRSLHVVFLVEKDMRVKRRRACDGLNDEQIRWQDNVCTRSDQKHRNEKERRIVAFVSEVRP
jgi:hypothetical protein